MKKVTILLENKGSSLKVKKRINGGKLLESFEPTNLKSTESVVLEGICIDFNEWSENDRFYSKEEYLEEFNRLAEIAEKRELFGSADHPDREDFIVKSNEIACIIEKLWYVESENRCYIRLRLIPTIIGGGYDLIQVVNNGGVLSTSSRAVGYLDEDTKTAYIDTMYTYDIVTTPGMKIATLRVVDTQSGKKINESIEIKPKQEFLEKAKSAAQQKLFGQALAVRQGKLSKGDVDDSVLDIVNGDMTDKQIEEFASTKLKNLPQKIGESTTNNKINNKNIDMDYEKGQELKLNDGSKIVLEEVPHKGMGTLVAKGKKGDESVDIILNEHSGEWEILENENPILEMYESLKKKALKKKNIVALKEIRKGKKAYLSKLKESVEDAEEVAMDSFEKAEDLMKEDELTEAFHHLTRKRKKMNESMSAEDIIEEYKNEVLPIIKKKYENDGRIDRDARYQAFVDFVDSLSQEDLISEEMADDVALPDGLLNEGFHHLTRRKKMNESAQLEDYVGEFIRDTFPNPKVAMKNYKENGESFYKEAYAAIKSMVGDQYSEDEIRNAIDDYATLNEGFHHLTRRKKMKESEKPKFSDLLNEGKITPQTKVDDIFKAIDDKFGFSNDNEDDRFLHIDDIKSLGVSPEDVNAVAQILEDNGWGIEGFGINEGFHHLTKRKRMKESVNLGIKPKDNSIPDDYMEKVYDKLSMKDLLTPNVGAIQQVIQKNGFQFTPEEFLQKLYFLDFEFSPDFERRAEMLKKHNLTESRKIVKLKESEKPKFSDLLNEGKITPQTKVDDIFKAIDDKFGFSNDNEDDRFLHIDDIKSLGVSPEDVNAVAQILEDNGWGIEGFGINEGFHHLTKRKRMKESVNLGIKPKDNSIPDDYMEKVYDKLSMKDLLTPNVGAIQQVIQKNGFQFTPEEFLQKLYFLDFEFSPDFERRAEMLKKHNLTESRKIVKLKESAKKSLKKAQRIFENGNPITPIVDKEVDEKDIKGGEVIARKGNQVMVETDDAVYVVESGVAMLEYTDGAIEGLTESKIKVAKKITKSKRRAMKLVESQEFDKASDYAEEDINGDELQELEEAINDGSAVVAISDIDEFGDEIAIVEHDGNAYFVEMETKDELEEGFHHLTKRKKMNESSTLPYGRMWSSLQNDVEWFKDEIPLDSDAAWILFHMARFVDPYSDMYTFDDTLSDAIKVAWEDGIDAIDDVWINKDGIHYYYKVLKDLKELNKKGEIGWDDPSDLIKFFKEELKGNEGKKFFETDEMFEDPNNFEDDNTPIRKMYESVKKKLNESIIEQNRTSKALSYTTKCVADLQKVVESLENQLKSSTRAKALDILKESANNKAQMKLVESVLAKYPKLRKLKENHSVALIKFDTLNDAAKQEVYDNVGLFNESELADVISEYNK